MYDVSALCVIVPVAVQRSFAPPRTSIFVSTHTFVPGTSISYALLLPPVAEAVCAHTALRPHIKEVASRVSVRSLIAVDVCAIFMVCPRLDCLP